MYYGNYYHLLYSGGETNRSELKLSNLRTNATECNILIYIYTEKNF